jgi:uncharacterized membrane protein required for colicin V production
LNITGDGLTGGDALHSHDSDEDDRMPQSDSPEQGAQCIPGFVWVFRVVLFASLITAFVVGGPVARVAAVSAAVFAFFGDLDGGVRHTLRVVGLGVAIWLAPGLGGPIGGWIASQFAVPVLLAKALGTLTAGIGVLIGIGLLGRFARRFTRRRRRLNAFDRVFGGAVGAAEGALLIAAGCWALAILEEPLRLMRYQFAQDHRSPSSIRWMVQRLDDFNAVVRRDPTGRMVRSVNPLPDIPAVRAIQQVAEVVAEPETLTALVQSRELREIAQLPVVKKHLDAIQNDQKLKSALENRDFATVLKSPQWSAMLNDPELFDTIMSRAADIRNAMRSVSAARAREMAKSAGPGAKQRARRAATQARATVAAP